MTQEVDSGATVASQRSRRLLLGIGGSLLSRSLGMLAPLVLIPVTLSYLGTTYFGLWMTLAAAAAFAAFADLGLGNGLMTRLPEALARRDMQLARDLVSSAYAVLSCVALVVVVGVWATVDIVPWPSMFDPRGTADRETVRMLAGIAFSALAISVPCALVTRVYYAKQRASAAAAWQAAASLAPLGPVLIAIHMDAGPVAVVALALISGPVVSALNTVWCFAKVYPELRPSGLHVTRSAVRDMSSLGLRFFALTVALLVANNSDNLILAQTVGLSAVAVFAVPARVFLQLGQLVSLVNIPMWSASSDALARSDSAWVQRTARRMVVYSCAAVAAVSLPLVVFGEEMMRLWTGGPLQVPTALVAGFATWWLIMAGLSPLFMVQNGAGVVLPQLVGWVLYALVSVPVKAVAAASLGPSAIPWVGVAALLTFVAPSAVFGYRQALRGLSTPRSGGSNK